MSFKMFFNSLLIALLCAFAFSFSACASSNKNYKSNSVMSRTIFAEPVAPENQSIFIALRNTSGKELDLQNAVVQDLRARGYQISTDPQKAEFVLQANVLYCDEQEKSNTTTGAAIGAASGGVIGAGAGQVMKGNKSATMDGAVAGAAVGAVLGGLGGFFNSTKTYELRVDIRVRQKGQKEQTTTITANASGMSNLEEAIPELRAQFAKQVAGIF